MRMTANQQGGEQCSKASRIRGWWDEETHRGYRNKHTWMGNNCERGIVFFRRKLFLRWDCLILYFMYHTSRKLHILGGGCQILDVFLSTCGQIVEEDVFRRVSAQCELETHDWGVPTSGLEEVCITFQRHHLWKDITWDLTSYPPPPSWQMPFKFPFF